MNEARTILRNNRAAADAVLAGTKHFDEALKAVEAAQQEESGKEKKLARLRDGAPDLAALVGEPIMLDPEGLLIDGRNRLAACNLAGVEPRFEWAMPSDDVGIARQREECCRGR